MTEINAPILPPQANVDDKAIRRTRGSLTKPLTDAEELLRVLIRLTPPTKPWQRSLRNQLMEADRHAQILRMTLVLNRSDAEVMAATMALSKGLAAAETSASKGRANDVTRAAIALARSLVKRIESRPEQD